MSVNPPSEASCSKRQRWLAQRTSPDQPSRSPSIPGTRATAHDPFRPPRVARASATRHCQRSSLTIARRPPFTITNGSPAAPAHEPSRRSSHESRTPWTLSASSHEPSWSAPYEPWPQRTLAITGPPSTTSRTTKSPQQEPRTKSDEPGRPTADIVAGSSGASNVAASHIYIKNYYTRLHNLNSHLRHWASVKICT